MIRTAFPDECIPQAIDEIRSAPEGEPALWFVLKESEATKIVSAAENGRAYAIIDILKRQPWWTELAAAGRGLPQWVASRSDVPEVRLRLPRRPSKHLSRALARPEISR